LSVPRFNFALGKKEFKGDKLKIEDNTILILEGIHALKGGALQTQKEELN